MDDELKQELTDMITDLESIRMENDFDETQERDIFSAIKALENLQDSL